MLPGGIDVSRTSERTGRMVRSGVPKRNVVQVRVTPAEKARIEQAAAAENRTVSNWIYGLIVRELGKDFGGTLRKVAEPRRTR
jgi:hypothetical protein